jgi:hypothetical protein
MSNIPAQGRTNHDIRGKMLLADDTGQAYRRGPSVGEESRQWPGILISKNLGNRPGCRNVLGRKRTPEMTATLEKPSLSRTFSRPLPPGHYLEGATE